MTVTWERLAELVQEAVGRVEPMAALYFLIREEAAKERDCEPGCELRGGHTGNCRSKKP
jgi:hypothetical protein